MNAPLHIVSISGGKDSQATAILCMDRCANADVRFAFADTGHEHQITYGHLDYLEQAWGRPITRLKADFTREIARKRDFVLANWAKDGVTQQQIDLAVATLVPSGNTFLDLCIWKGRFPSRKAQFCTQHLKRYLLDRFMIDTILGLDPESSHSWQGVRRDESAARAHVPDRELAAEGWWIERPIAGWTAQEVIDLSLARGLRLNPLYSMGMHRVGCMPCINSSKDEIAEIARRFPDVIDKLRLWEELVGRASKRGFATFFTERAEDDEEPSDIFARANIDQKVAWARTSRGGRQFDLEKAAPPAECSSVYGLCE